MKIAKYYSNSDIRIIETPVPKIGKDEILVRIESSGICGSDVMEWYRKDKVPLVLGHEVSGEIVEVGEDVKSYKIGQRIVAAHHVPCGECHFCKMGHETTCDTLRRTNFDPGGFAQFVRLPKINIEKGIFPIPENVSYDEATFVEPLACIIRGYKQANMKCYRQGKNIHFPQRGLSEPRANEVSRGASSAARKGNGFCPAQTHFDIDEFPSILVIGSGITGLLHIKLAKFIGASIIAATDINDFRLEAAKKSGADFVFNAKDYTPEKFKEINNGLLADLVIVCSGATQAINQAIQSVERGGTILFFAPTSTNPDITIPFNKLFWRNEITLTSSYAGTPDEHRQAMQLISGKKFIVSDLISHILPFDKTEEGFKLVVDAKESLKIIVRPWK